ncbi:condensation domain-containing protein [Spirillospora sp. NPDC052269]
MFAEVLGLDQVSIDDGFFELGGDSIISLQVVSRAHKAGLTITAKDVFQHKTPQALAAIAEPVNDRHVTHDDGQGDIPLTPIMRQLAERDGLTGPIHQAMTVWTPPAMSMDDLTATLQSVLDHHGALRMRLDRDTLWGRPPGEVRAADLLRRSDAATCDERALSEHREAAVRHLDPESGVMLQADWFDAGSRAPGRLLIVAHHLAVDGVSWRILQEDLATAWDAITSGEVPVLPPVSTSFRTWARLLTEAATARSTVEELPIWLATSASARTSEPGPQRAAEPDALRMMLSVETTTAVLTTVPAAFHADVTEVLLTGMALALADWRSDTAVLAALERHGREAGLADGVDLSRTVGWFTSTHPVRPDLGEVAWEDVWSGGHGVAAAVKKVKEHLRALPNNGIGHGLLRHLNETTAPALAELDEPFLLFNYLGRFAMTAGEPIPWTPVGEDRPAAVTLTHTVDVDAMTEDTPAGPRLVADWAWDPGRLAEEDVRHLGRTWFRALEALVACAERGDAGGRTPSDLGLITLTQDDIDQLEMEWGQ